MLLGVPFVLATTQVGAAGIAIGSGASVDFGNATVDLGCTDLTVAGTANANAAQLSSVSDLAIASGGALSGGAGSVALGGNFSNAGSFIAGASRISIVDACGSASVSSLSGSSAFYDLLIGSSIGKKIAFPAGLTQRIAHAFTLQGAAGHLLQVVSSNAGNPARLNVAAAAAQTIDYVNAQDNDASAGATIAPGAAVTYHSIDAGDLNHWFAAAGGGPGGGVPVPAPALEARGLIVLLLAVSLGALVRLRSHSL